jgi:gustatory receptor
VNLSHVVGHIYHLYNNQDFKLQILWLFLALSHAMMMDTMFCCWLIYTCEQLIHLKEIMKPLMELSASLDTVVPHSADLFRAVSATTNAPIPSGI